MLDSCISFHALSLDFPLTLGFCVTFRFRWSWPGLYQSTRHKVRQFSASGLIYARSLKKVGGILSACLKICTLKLTYFSVVQVKAMWRCLELPVWMGSKLSGSILGG